MSLGKTTFRRFGLFLSLIWLGSSLACGPQNTTPSTQDGIQIIDAPPHTDGGEFSVSYADRNVKPDHPTPPPDRPLPEPPSQDNNPAIDTTPSPDHHPLQDNTPPEPPPTHDAPAVENNPPEPRPEPRPEPLPEPRPEPRPEPPPIPSVQLVSPTDGATVKNPVTFTIAAKNVAKVRIFAGTYALSDFFDPSTKNQHTYRFYGVNKAHTIALVGYDLQNKELTRTTITITVIEPQSTDIGTLFGRMWITYYYLSNENNYSGSATTGLYDKNCKVITRVAKRFSDSVCIEGSGILKDGRVINYYKTCSCGARCPTGGIICYSVLDKKKFPWGKGSRSNPLVPLRSFAVDNRIIRYGTMLYIKEWDGVMIPKVDGLGGFKHDGCFRADDVGGAIKGMHYDFFSGTKGMYRALNKIHPTKKYLTVYKNAGRCKNVPW